jgi:hypothetical protein
MPTAPATASSENAALNDLFDILDVATDLLDIGGDRLDWAVFGCSRCWCGGCGAAADLSELSFRHDTEAAVLGSVTHI